MADGTIAGLYLFASPEPGRGKWILRYVSPVLGKRRDMGLGRYPEVGLADARRLAFDARVAIGDGTDPLEVRRAEQDAKREQMRTPTFEAAARTVFEELRRGFRNPKHADQWISTLERFVFPSIGSRVVSELKASDFAGALQPIWLDLPETASRVRQRCDTVMKWCAAQDHVVASPVGIVGKLLARQPGKRERVEHHPAVPWRELPEFVRDRLRPENGSVGKQALELLILTATRSGEIRGMTWEELDVGKRVWTVPASRMKAKVAHRVPLSDRAMEILLARRAVSGDCRYIFASRKGKPLSDMTLSKILRDAKVRSDTDGRVATPHGFRSSFRDWASENGHARDLAERALAHTIRDTSEAAYHRTDLLDARRPMMEAWSAFLSGS